MSTIIVLNLIRYSKHLLFYPKIFKNVLVIQIFLNFLNVQLVALILSLCEHTVGTPDVSTSAGNAVYALRAVKCVQMYALDQTERD